MIMDTGELLKKIEAAARQAGEIMLGATHIADGVSEKEGHGNFVTLYDAKVQEFLFAEMKKILPEAKFVGEEEGKNEFREEYRSGYTFVIDPIDGTANFLTGVRPSVTSIGLLKDGKPWLGVICNPYEGLVFSAVRGMGAFCNGNPIHSSERPLKYSLVTVGTAPSFEKLYDMTFALARRYTEMSMDIRHSGAAAWNLCQLACGRIGLFYELRLSLWDFTAGAVIAEEAGAVITDPQGRPLTYDGPSGVIGASCGVVKEGGYLPADVLGDRWNFPEI